MSERWTRIAVGLAVAGAIVGVFATWLADGAVTMNGVEGPNDGWLVLILALFVLAWTPALLRGSWVAVLGVLGSALVMGLSALGDWLDWREVTGAHGSYGLLLVAISSFVLAAAAVWAAARRLGLTARRPSAAGGENR